MLTIHITMTALVSSLAFVSVTWYIVYRWAKKSNKEMKHPRAWKMKIPADVDDVFDDTEKYYHNS